MAQITLAEGAAPATPAAGKLAIYAKTDSVLYTKDDAGTETAISGTASETAAGMVELASTSEVTGTHTTGSITSGTTALTVASGTGINNGDYVVGEGITPGTKVSSGGGTTSITLSANAGATLSSDPVSFYRADRACSPGVLAGMLARAWVNFNGTGTVAIRAGYNVTSITDNGTGNYTVNFTTALPDANYSTACLIGSDVWSFGSNNALGAIARTDVSSTSAMRVYSFYADTNGIGQAFDAPTMCATVFR